MWRGVLPEARLVQHVPLMSHRLRGGHWDTRTHVSGTTGTTSVTSEVTGFFRIFCSVFCKSYLNLYRSRSTKLYGTVLPQLNNYL